MSIEERFDQLLMETIKYWKVDSYDVDGYNSDNKVSTFLRLSYKRNGKKLTFFISYRDIWLLLQTEYSLGNQQTLDFTSSRLEQAYNFMDITTWETNSLLR